MQSRKSLLQAVGRGGAAGWPRWWGWQVAGEQEEDASRGKGHTLSQDNTPRIVLALLHVFCLSFLELHLLIRKEIHKWYITQEAKLCPGVPWSMEHSVLTTWLKTK